MKRHVKRSHEASMKCQKHVCQEIGCGKVFRNMRRLQKHERYHARLNEVTSSQARCTRSKKNHSIPSEQTQSPPPFRTLISTIKSPEDLKPPLMKALYSLLLSFSLDQPFCGSDSSPPEVDFRDMHKLSNMLFKQLDHKFKEFFAYLYELSYSGTDMHTAVMEELTLLLRCSMAVLNFLDGDQNLLLEGVQILLFIVKVLTSLDATGDSESKSERRSCISFEKSVLHEGGDGSCSTYVAENLAASLCFLEPYDLCQPSLNALLEVLADELLTNSSLGEYLMLVDSSYSKNEVLFMSHFSNGSIGSVLEVVSAHFVLSVSEEQAFGNFINRLTWQHGKGFRFPELSMSPAISLLLNPIMLSAPKMFQAHVISLVSEAIGVGLSSGKLIPDPRFLECYLMAFEKSINLYTRHMSSLQMDDHPIGSKASANAHMLGRSQPTFDSCVREATRNKINQVVSRSDDFWDSYLQNMLFGTKSDLVAGSLLYLKESQHVVDELCRDEILSILDSLVLRAFSDDVSDIKFFRKGETSPDDIYLLASILKLMSSSLVQAICCLRQSVNFKSLKTLDNTSSCKQYDFMVAIIRCFKQFNVCLPVQRFLCDMMKTHTSHEESKWMILHFSGLLCLSFSSGLNFLVKGCISMMMALMNLFAFEEGDLLVLRPLLGTGSEAELHDQVQEPSVAQKSSERLASRFQKIRKLHLRSIHQKMENEQGQTSQNVSILNQMEEETVDGTEEETEETCNGEIFLNCVLEGSRGIPDYDDLADFIECKRGKDYSAWLKDRQRFRNWKCQKMAVLRWKKRKKTWKFFERKKL